VKWLPLRDDSKRPERATDGSCGYDVFASRVLDRKTKAVIGELPVEIKPGESVLKGIGIAFEVYPACYAAEMGPRSGFEPKFGIRLGGAPGTLDSDFRGESTVFLLNEGDQPFLVEKHMRIAQLVFRKVETPAWERASALSQTKRDQGSFGSTGLKEIKK
jgi:dUTP pyrophosphatase